MEGIFVPISFFLAIFAILYVYWTTRTKERIALVEKGTDASIFKTTGSKYMLLKWGIFLIALSAGVITGYALSNVIHEVAAFFTMILFAGGVGLIVAYLIVGALEKRDSGKGL